MVHEQGEGLAHLTDLDVTWGFDLHAFLRDCSQGAPAAGDGGDLHAFLRERSQETLCCLRCWRSARALAGALTRGPCRRRCWRRNSRDDGVVSRGRGRRLLGPGREGRNSRDDGLISRGRGGRLLGPDREGRKRLRRISSLRHRPREQRRFPRDPVEYGSSRAQ